MWVQGMLKLVKGQTHRNVLTQPPHHVAFQHTPRLAKFCEQHKRLCTRWCFKKSVSITKKLLPPEPVGGFVRALFLCVRMLNDN